MGLQCYAQAISNIDRSGLYMGTMQEDKSTSKDRTQTCGDGIGVIGKFMTSRQQRGGPDRKNERARRCKTQAQVIA
jgi:hypothetical protein